MTTIKDSLPNFGEMVYLFLEKDGFRFTTEGFLTTLVMRRSSELDDLEDESLWVFASFSKFDSIIKKVYEYMTSDIKVIGWEYKNENHPI